MVTENVVDKGVGSFHGSGQLNERNEMSSLGKTVNDGEDYHETP